MSIKISETSTYYVPIIYLFTLVLVNFNKSNLTYKPSGNNTNKIINLSKRRNFKYKRILVLSRRVSLPNKKRNMISLRIFIRRNF